MSPTKLDRRIIGELERFLRDELARLQGSLRAVVTEARSTESTSLTDMSVHAAETLHTEIQVALLDRRTQQAVQIQDALARLAEGRYGFCQDCEEFVGLARLRALPFAQRCRDCQGQAERRARRESVLLARVSRASAGDSGRGGVTSGSGAPPPRSGRAPSVGRVTGCGRAGAGRDSSSLRRPAVHDLDSDRRIRRWRGVSAAVRSAGAIVPPDPDQRRPLEPR